MKKKTAWLLICAAMLCGCGSENLSGSTLNVAVASNMQITMEEVAKLFEDQTGVRVQISSASSGVLSAQIRQGAPFDVFVSANMFYPLTLFEMGLTSTAPKIFAHGTLILWSLDAAYIEAGIVTGLPSLQADAVENFAIANPETAPYGIAAVQALSRIELLSRLNDRIVIGESVGQVNQYVSSGSVQVGITSSSVMHSTTLEFKGASYEIDRDLYDPIEHGIVILQDGIKNNPESSERFQAFMFSPEVQAVLLKHGYRASMEFQ